MAITLQQLLQARDDRRDLQLRLIRENAGKTLIVLTINIPGSEKRTPESLIIGQEGVKVLKETFNTATAITRDLPTGFEAFLLTDVSGREAKKLTVGIESEHPLGRLMDIDVFDPDGSPISRIGIGKDARSCLICGRDARICMRTFAHPLPELHNKIRSIVNGFLQRH